ncbi:MAG: hypothetical protein JNK87_05865 [Bryobacterales bacterium]|nr:hypothetical protein [Bryobacterales bacterium]
MAALNWTPLYDFSNERFTDWPIVLAGALGMAGVLAYMLWRKQHTLPVPWMSWFMLAWFGVIVIFGGVFPFYDYSRLHTMLRAGRVQKAEGLLTGHSLQEISYRRSGDRAGYLRYVTYESFQIGGTTFAYYQKPDAHGFRNTGRQKVPLQDGMFLRAWYTTDNHGFADGPRILRLEQAAPGR